ncbi:MAG: hypothetical protein M0027_07415 [Candidatus Dormibacteraeota bacterium]|nr:hypothetical protein [Candidatus Dormibacteraeota bacterium]
MFDSSSSYSDRGSEIQAAKAVQYADSMGQEIAAAIDAGLAVRWLAKCPRAPRDRRGDGAGPEVDGLCPLRLGVDTVPMPLGLVTERHA